MCRCPEGSSVRYENLNSGEQFTKTDIDFEDDFICARESFNNDDNESSEESIGRCFCTLPN